MGGLLSHEHSAANVNRVAIGPHVNTGNGNFKPTASQITMVQANPFHGLAKEDAKVHLHKFLKACKTLSIEGVNQDVIRLRLFPYSLAGEVRQWFFANPSISTTWDACSEAFLDEYSPRGKTYALHAQIPDYWRAQEDSIPEAWEKLQDYLTKYPAHGMDDWTILIDFYHGLTQRCRDYLDSRVEGGIFSLTAAEATKLVEKVAIGEGWRPRSQQKEKPSNITLEGKQRGRRLRTSALKRQLQPQHEKLFASSSPGSSTKSPR